MGREGPIDLSWPDPLKVAVSCVDLTTWKWSAPSTPAGARAPEMTQFYPLHSENCPSHFLVSI